MDVDTQRMITNFNHFQRIKIRVSEYNVFKVDINNKGITRKPPYLKIKKRKLMVQIKYNEIKICIN